MCLPQLREMTLQREGSRAPLRKPFQNSGTDKGGVKLRSLFVGHKLLLVAQIFFFAVLSHRCCYFVFWLPVRSTFGNEIFCLYLASDTCVVTLRLKVKVSIGYWRCVALPAASTGMLILNDIKRNRQHSSY